MTKEMYFEKELKDIDYIKENDLGKKRKDCRRYYRCDCCGLYHKRSEGDFIDGLFLCVQCQKALR